MEYFSHGMEWKDGMLNSVVAITFPSYLKWFNMGFEIFIKFRYFSFFYFWDSKH